MHHTVYTPLMKRLMIAPFLMLTACTPLLASCAPSMKATPESSQKALQEQQPAPHTPCPNGGCYIPNDPVPPVPAPKENIPAVLAGFTRMPLAEAPIRQFAAAKQVTDKNKQYRAVLKTSKGDIILSLNNKSPEAVNNFVFLAKNRFYDGTRFHRVIEGFMAQVGDPKSSDLALINEWGTGGPGYQFMAEVDNGLKFDKAGVLGMARSNRMDSQGSQFFVTFAPASFLDGQYTVFGEVLEGLDILNSITKGGRDGLTGLSADVLLGVEIWEK